jgi:hypothetical protein
MILIIVLIVLALACWYIFYLDQQGTTTWTTTLPSSTFPAGLDWGSYMWIPAVLLTGAAIWFIWRLFKRK